jgi:hypothetical protein
MVNSLYLKNPKAQVGVKSRMTELKRVNCKSGMGFVLSDWNKKIHFRAWTRTPCRTLQKKTNKS